MTLRRAALALALATTGGVAHATDWKPAGRTFGGNEVYVDAAAMRRAGDVRTTWVRVVYARPVDVPGGEARSFEALAHFDCRAGSSAGIAVILYADEAGSRVLLHTQEESVRFNRDPEGSFGALASETICR